MHATEKKGFPCTTAALCRAPFLVNEMNESNECHADDDTDDDCARRIIR